MTKADAARPVTHRRLRRVISASRAPDVLGSASRKAVSAKMCTDSMQHLEMQYLPLYPLYSCPESAKNIEYFKQVKFFCQNAAEQHTFSGLSSKTPVIFC